MWKKPVFSRQQEVSKKVVDEKRSRIIKSWINLYEFDLENYTIGTITLSEAAAGYRPVQQRPEMRPDLRDRKCEGAGRIRPVHKINYRENGN